MASNESCGNCCGRGAFAYSTTAGNFWSPCMSCGGSGDSTNGPQVLYCAHGRINGQLCSACLGLSEREQPRLTLELPLSPYEYDTTDEPRGSITISYSAPSKDE